VTLAWIAIGACAAWVLFGWAGYPLALLVLRRLSPLPARKAEISPPLSIIIAAHNAERELEGKLESTLALGYAGPLQILVSSDASTDGTEAIAERFAARGVELVHSRERRGKEAAQAAAIARATGEVLLFTDVAARFDAQALRALLRGFADPRVGAVSSEDEVDSAGGEGAYVRYEMALRRLESEAATLIGVSGSCFAVRRALGSPWPADLASDFRVALEAARRGLRAISEPEARVRFRASEQARSEWSRKVRTVRRGLAVLFAYRDLLHPRHGRVALALWGHKLARFTQPFALLGLLAASAAAAPESPLALALLLAQLALYGLGALCLWRPQLERSLIPRLAAFFVLVSASMLVAWAYHLSGQRAVVWQPTRR
jgi:cellulose synthase/poly-beta-1,6-N-acetylglucosamine synthase-like glycosyltransferase